jgi:hypothetical protein
MNLFGIILGYFYTVVLSLWGIALPQYDYFNLEEQSIKLEISSEEVGSLDQPDIFFLLSQSNNLYPGGLQGYGHPEIDHFFNGYPFPDLYWNNFGAAVFSFLVAVNIQFEPTDIIFPFHFFW